MVKIEFDINTLGFAKEQFAVAEELLKPNSSMVSVYKHILDRMAGKWKFSYEMINTSESVLTIHIFTELDMSKADFATDVAWLEQELLEVLLDGSYNFELYVEDGQHMQSKKLAYRQRVYE
jgi:hypothetical protein